MPHTHRLKTGKCEQCGATFTHRQSRAQRFCSNLCRAQGSHGPQRFIGPRIPLGDATEIMCPLNWRRCKDCGLEWLTPKGATNRFCRGCIKLRHTADSSRRFYEKTAHLGPRGSRRSTCSVCGRQYIAKSVGGATPPSPAEQCGWSSTSASLGTNTPGGERFSAKEIYEKRRIQVRHLWQGAPHGSYRPLRPADDTRE